LALISETVGQAGQFRLTGGQLLAKARQVGTPHFPQLVLAI
jgi:hypothetical protein